MQTQAVSHPKTRALATAFLHPTALPQNKRGTGRGGNGRWVFTQKWKVYKVLWKHSVISQWRDLEKAGPQTRKLLTPACRTTGARAGGQSGTWRSKTPFSSLGRGTRRALHSSLLTACPLSSPSSHHPVLGSISSPSPAWLRRWWHRWTSVNTVLNESVNESILEAEG